MCPSVAYTHCATSLREHTGDIRTFTQFEQGNSPSETNPPSENCNNAEIDDKSDDYSIMTPLLSEEKMNAMDSGDESDHDPISTEVLGDIHDIGQSHPNVNRR